MDRRIVAGGLGLGVAVFIGIAVLSGQYVPPTGSGLPIGCTSGERPEWDGDSWECRSLRDYRSATLEWVNECTGTSFPGEYTNAVAGTGATLVVADGQGRPGVCNINTGTTTTGSSRLARSGFAFTLSAMSTWHFEAVAGVPTLSTASEEFAVPFGCRDTSGNVTQTNGCYFLYDRANVHTGGCNTGNLDKWSVVCANNGTRTRLLLDGTSQDGACGAGAITTVDSPVAALTLPSTNIYKLEIDGTTTSAVFKINGTVRATITTNIPSALGRHCGDSIGIIKSAGTTDRQVYVDRIAVKVTLPAPRSP